MLTGSVKQSKALVGLSSLMYGTVNIKELPLSRYPSPLKWEQVVGAVAFFISCLLSFGRIKFHPLLKMHLGAFINDTSTFLPSYHVTAISQQATEKKMY